jgi:putative Ca2+/H+ antiporter (TMEM165/GDT1 family)
MEFLKACFFILMAEMGDKTQILALAFATKYNVKNVLLGVLIGSFLNHGLAVILGAYLSSVIPLGVIKLVAACSFIAFGLWSLKDDAEEEDGEAKEKFGPVVTVAIAFFIGELGDKTQLTAITLSTSSAYPAIILVGTVTGMIITSGIGIFVGSKLGKSIPEFTMKIISSAIFIFFGILGLYEAVPSKYITLPYTLLFFATLSTIVYLLLSKTIKSQKEHKTTKLRRTAELLRERVQNIKPAVEKICLGEDKCGVCQGNKCRVGAAKEVINKSLDSSNYIVNINLSKNNSFNHKEFSKEKTLEALNETVKNCIGCIEEHDKSCVVNIVREMLENEYLGENLAFEGDIEKYMKLLNSKIHLSNKSAG